ncbi:MAG: hypothetical protein JO300_09575 [Silvibacterium sp.]|nr:hypothetical protein [Silvibacterium sp.]MBV8437299.1 hypothetical protein [Silvibacterium sp.]
MEEKKTTIQARARYSWRSPDASGLRKPIEDHLISAVSAASYVSASVVQTTQDQDVEQTVEFGTVQEWLNALDEPAKSYRLYASQGSTSLDLTIGSDTVNVSMRSEVQRAAESQAQIAAFATAAGLKPAETRKPSSPALPPPTSSFRRSGSYRLLDVISAENCLKAVDVVSAWLGDAIFSGAITSKADPGTAEEIRDAEPWKNAITRRWQDLATVEFRGFRTVRTANLRLQIPEKFVTLSASAEDASALRDVFDGFESTLRVAPRVTPVAQLKGEKKLYYTQQPINDEWIHRCLEILTKVAVNRTWFNGRYREADQDYTVSDFNLWRDEVGHRWSEMQSASCTISNDESRQSLDIDIKREQVGLELSRQPGAVASGAMTFLDYETELKLDPVPSRPYQYYRYARKYERTEVWSPEFDGTIATAIGNAVKEAFRDERRYVVVSASTTEGEVQQQLIPQTTLNGFLGRLRTHHDYVSAQIYLQGPRGYDLVIQLDRRLRTVAVRSSISDGKLFKDVIAPFEAIHDLKEYKREAKNLDASGQERKKTFWDRVPALVGGSGIVGCVIAVASWYFTAVSTHSSTLEILTPQQGANIHGKSSQVKWVVRRKSWTGDVPPEHPNADVHITKEGDADVKQDGWNVTNGYVANFPSDGVYDITVAIPMVQDGNIHVTVTVPDQPTKMAKASKKR